ncbi:MAG: chromate efflux transporter [Chloroflexi bacterium]|nr:chromate efflux transporter [Chloroflexota bacterium]
MTESAAEAGRPSAGGSPGEVARYFLRLGFIAFGGPAAHIAIMRRELVRERGWLTDAEFMDMLGVTNLIPGPNSTEMTMHIGARRAGWRGLWIGGAAFIGPAVLIVLALAWAYVRYGGTPAGAALILGIEPVVLAIIAQAVWGLRGSAFKSPPVMLVTIAAGGAAASGRINEAFIVLGGGVAMLAWSAATGGRGGGWPGAVLALRSRAASLPSRIRRKATVVALTVCCLLATAAPVALAATSSIAAAPATGVSRTNPPGYSLLELFWVFLRIGSVLYGGGYVLFSFLHADLVVARSWLTEQQLLDAISVGQFTPGPLFSSATFGGYIIGGFPGAGAATLGLFLPSFLFVTVTYPFVPRLRRSRRAAPFLDGVNAAAVALMAVVTVALARGSLDSVFTVGLFALAGAWLLRFNPSSIWVVAAGAAAGLAHALAT